MAAMKVAVVVISTLLLAGGMVSAINNLPSQCDGFGVRNNQTGVCACVNGWRGPNCNICTGSAACVRSGPNGTSGVCLADFQSLNSYTGGVYALSCVRQSVINDGDPVSTYPYANNFDLACDSTDGSCAYSVNATNLGAGFAECRATGCSITAKNIACRTAPTCVCGTSLATLSDQCPPALAQDLTATFTVTCDNFNRCNIMKQYANGTNGVQGEILCSVGACTANGASRVGLPSMLQMVAYMGALLVAYTFMM